MQIFIPSVLFAVLHQTTAINRCNKETRYQCGHDASGNPLQGTEPWWTLSCKQYDCCCPNTDGWDQSPPVMNSHDHQLNVCDYGMFLPGDKDDAIPSGTNVGCWACGKRDSCFNLASSTVGDESCVGSEACRGSDHMTIWNNACRHDNACQISSHQVIGAYSCSDFKACYQTENNNIGRNSCNGSNACSGWCDENHAVTRRRLEDEDNECGRSEHKIIGDTSCNKEQACHKSNYVTIGSQSCNNVKSCRFINEENKLGTIKESERVTIKDNACNYDTVTDDTGASTGVCQRCAAGSLVPNGACSGTSMDDLSSDGKCNYCLVSCLFVLYGYSITSQLIIHVTFSPLSFHNTIYKSTAQKTSVVIKLVGVIGEEMCNAAATDIKDTVKDAIKGHATFRDHHEGTIKGCKNKDKIKHNLFDKTCTITQSFVANVRGLNKDEESMQDHVKKAIVDRLSMSIDTIWVTDENCKEKKKKGDKSSKKKGKGKKAAKAGL